MSAPIITLPRRRRGRQTPQMEREFLSLMQSFADSILQIRSTLDFKVSSRGWAYILEQTAGLLKGDFDQAQGIINDCRKSGLLPLDICAVDDARAFDHVEFVDSTAPGAYVQDAIDSLEWHWSSYTPLSFWDDQPVYLQMVVEKIDLKSLFEPVCRRYRVPCANAKGWSDLHLRADMMRRFKEHEEAGRQCVLLYAGDHDPAGLRISDTLLSNMADLSGAVGWNPSGVIVDRFGLNHEFIEQHRLSWIDNLMTGSGKNLADPKHKDHGQAYVQEYIRQFGARKVEANALVVDPKAGRELCERAILKYLPREAPDRYEERLRPFRDEVRRIARQEAA
jgi:hypothetical protein